MRHWSYVGENAQLRQAAQDILRCWDEAADIKTWGLAIAALRKAARAENQPSWSDEAYAKGEK